MVISEDIALDRNPQEEFEFPGDEQTEVATDKVDFSPGGEYVWVGCDPEDPEFGKTMELDGRSSVSGDYGLADRNNVFFLSREATPPDLPSLLSDSINSLQKLKGMGHGQETSPSR